jgi:TPR repeat protein
MGTPADNLTSPRWWRSEPACPAIPKAIQLFRSSAEQGYAASQTGLARMFLLGRGVPRDETLGIYWLTNAARLGDPDAQQTLGVAYFEGRFGVGRDTALALQWLTRAAQQNNATAEYYLATAYRRGLGVPPDGRQAALLYERSASHGEPQAMLDLALMLDGGDGVPRDPAKALEWYGRAADYGYAQACHNLGAKYATGADVNVDRVRAYMWLLLAAAAPRRDAAHPSADAERMAAQLAERLTPDERRAGQAAAQRFPRDRWTIAKDGR